ncbi:MAG: hypothetical protein ACYDER_24655 [Ktedonobacteraceae bacterium]
MVSASRSLRGLYLLMVGIVTGIVLASLVHISTQFAPVLTAVILFLPFFLAILTGAAKTTTA